MHRRQNAAQQEHEWNLMSEGKAMRELRKGRKLCSDRWWRVPCQYLQQMCPYLEDSPETVLFEGRRP